MGLNLKKHMRNIYCDKVGTHKIKISLKADESMNLRLYIEKHTTITYVFLISE